jgi:hypothetical protein
MTKRFAPEALEVANGKGYESADRGRFILFECPAKVEIQDAGDFMVVSSYPCRLASGLSESSVTIRIETDVPTEDLRIVYDHARRSYAILQRNGSRYAASICDEWIEVACVMGH